MKKLNLGSSVSPKQNFDNADIQKHPSVQLCFDFNKFPYPIKDNVYDFVYAKSILEHLEKPVEVLNELWRVCKKGAIIEIIVPDYTNKAAYSELEHLHYFSDISFSAYALDHSQINKNKRFEIIFIRVVPTSIGRIFPGTIRKKLALFINGLISCIHIQYKVIK